MNSEHLIPPEARRFYDAVYEMGTEPEAAREEGRESWERAIVETFLRAYCPAGTPLLEVGCGHAPYQDRVEEYTGIDISPRCGAYLRKPYATASATALPFAASSFGAVMTLHTLEHVHAPQRMLEEILRVLRPGGAALLLPSWYVRFWAPMGIAARSYRELPTRWRIVKFFLPLLDAPLLRAPGVLLRRLAALAAYTLRAKPTQLRYRGVRANYARFLDSDSDACASIDPFQVMLFYHSRGCSVAQYPSWASRLLFRTGPLVIVKR